MMNMYTAITLSVGSKAKTRDTYGATIVIAMHYSSGLITWLMSRIEANGNHDGAGYGGDFGKLREALSADSVSPDDNIWLSVETPFPEEKG